MSVVQESVAPAYASERRRVELTISHLVGQLHVKMIRRRVLGGDVATRAFPRTEHLATAGNGGRVYVLNDQLASVMVALAN